MIDSDYKFRNDRRSRRFEKGRRGTPIDCIVIHHWGIKGQKWENLTNWLLEPNKNVSTHYIAMDGLVEQQVDEADTAWHGGNSPINLRSIGIECRPEATDGDYKTVAELVADIWSRYGKLELIPHNRVPSVRDGQSYVATSCPEDWDLVRLKKEADEWFAEKYEKDKDPEAWRKIDGIRIYDFDVPYIAGMAIQGYGQPVWGGGYKAIKRKGELINSTIRVDLADNSFVLCSDSNAWYLVKANNRWQVSDGRPRTHTVEQGETLWSIAEKYLGSGSRYSDIIAINNIKNPNLLKVGEVLTLPKE